MTDLCFEENAEQECESLAKQALALVDVDGEPVVDALQTMASLRLSQSRGVEAVAYALRTFLKMKAGCQALASLVGLREPEEGTPQAVELLELESVQQLPGFEFRCQSAKLLLECASALRDSTADENDREQECVEAALDVLGSLLAENDEVVEIWHLTGDALSVTNDPSVESVTHYWQRALEMLGAVKKSLEQDAFEAEGEEEDEMQQQLEDISCQMEELSNKITTIRTESSGGMEE